MEMDRMEEYYSLRCGHRVDLGKRSGRRQRIWVITTVSVNVILDREKSIPVRRFGVRRTEEIRPSGNHRRSGINDITTIYPSCSYCLWINSSKFFGV